MILVPLPIQLSPPAPLLVRSEYHEAEGVALSADENNRGVPDAPESVRPLLTPSPAEPNLRLGKSSSL